MKRAMTLSALLAASLLSAQLLAQSVDLTEAIEKASHATVSIEWQSDAPQRSPEQLAYYDSLLSASVAQQISPPYIEALKSYKAQASQPARATFTNGTLLTADGILVAPKRDTGTSPSKILVQLTDKQHEAKLVLVDERSQLCLIKIDVEDTPFIELSDAPARIGSIVANVSTALDGSAVAATGIIAAVNRKIAPKFPPMLQTDLSIDVGGSGSPLLSADGKMTGVIMAKEGAGSQAASFAIPGALIANMLDHLEDKPAKDSKAIILSRGFLGIQLEEQDQGEGVVVEAVLPKSAAEKAGLQAGDRILAINEESVDSPEATVELLGRQSVGTLLRIHLIRDDMEFEIPARMGARTQEAYVTAKNDPSSYLYSRVYPPAAASLLQGKRIPKAAQSKPLMASPENPLATSRSPYTLEVQRAKSDLEISALQETVIELKAEMHKLEAKIAELKAKLEER